MGKLDGSEKILCVRKSDINEFLENGFVEGHKARLLPRTEELENDPEEIQLVVYCVVVRKTRSGDIQYLAYRRAKSGAEGRLHGLISLGYGGHICEADTLGVSCQGWIPWVAAARELKEELGFTDAELAFAVIDHHMRIYTPEFGGVEAHHAGFLFMVNAGMDFEPRPTDDSVEHLGWLGAEELLSIEVNEFEAWSRVFRETFEESLRKEG